jgi:hypothetical protein
VQDRPCHRLRRPRTNRYTGGLNNPRLPAWKTGQALGITRPVHISGHEMCLRAPSHTVLRTVNRYCHSADPVLARHVPLMRGLNACGEHAQLADAVMPFATKARTDLHDPDRGVVRFEHDHYLKMRALTEPRIEADFLLLDEAQDTTVMDQHPPHAEPGPTYLVSRSQTAPRSGDLRPRSPAAGTPGLRRRPGSSP